MKKFKRILLAFAPFCNYDCVFCGLGVHDTSSALRIKDFKEFDSYIQAATIVNITGYGEITMHPDFEEIIKRITQHGRRIEISTNGSLLTENRIKLLEESSLYILNISLNSLDKDIYKELTKGGSLDIVLKNIDNICKSKIKDIFYLQCSFVINKKNFHEIKNFIDFGEKYNINIKLSDLTPCIKDYDPELVIEDNKKNRAYLEECNNYGESKLGGKFHTFFFENRSKEHGGQGNNEEHLRAIIKGCEYIDNIVSIDVDGSVRACCWHPNTILGNVKDKSLDEIMNSDIYNDLRVNVKNGTFKYCKDCRRLG